MKNNIAHTQRNLILEHLRNGNKITGLQALELFNCYGGFRARISELLKDYPIESRFIKTDSGKTIKEYWLNIKQQGELF